MEVLGKIGEEKAAWGRLRSHTRRKTVPGVVVIRLDVPLFWVNATEIEDRLLAELDKWPDTRALVLDLEATSQLDTTSVDMLEHLHAELAAADIRLYLARVIHRVSDVLDRSGFLDTLGDEHIWHSISQCVRAARRATGLKGGAAGGSEARSDSPETPAGPANGEDAIDVLEEEAETQVLDDEDDEEAPEVRRWPWQLPRGREPR